MLAIDRRLVYERCTMYDTLGYPNDSGLEPADEERVQEFGIMLSLMPVEVIISKLGKPVGHEQAAGFITRVVDRAAQDRKFAKAVENCLAFINEHGSAKQGPSAGDG